MGPPGAALLARCAAQSCEKQGALLSWSIVQRGCESSTAPVLWCESLMGGNLQLHRHAQPALRPGAEACGLANGASFSTLSSASRSMSQHFCGDEWRAGCVVPRVEWEARGTRLSVNSAAHARRGSCSTGDLHGANAIAVTASNFAYQPPSVIITESLVGGYGAQELRLSEIADLPFFSLCREGLTSSVPPAASYLISSIRTAGCWKCVSP